MPAIRPFFAWPTLVTRLSDAPPRPPPPRPPCGCVSFGASAATSLLNRSRDAFTSPGMSCRPPIAFARSGSCPASDPRATSASMTAVSSAWTSIPLPTTPLRPAAASAPRRGRRRGIGLHADIPARGLYAGFVAVGQHGRGKLADLASGGVGDLQLHVADLLLVEPRDHRRRGRVLAVERLVAPELVVA